MVSRSEVRTLYAQDAYWWTRTISYEISSRLVAPAMRARLTPNTISFGNALLGVVTSASVALIYASAPWAAALIGFLGWQLAYSLDCLDGQIARITGTAKPSGAVVDLLYDLITHTAIIAVAVHIATAHWDSQWQTALAVVVAMAWIAPFFYSGIAARLADKPQPRRRTPILEVARLLFDHGFRMAVLPIAIFLSSWVVLAVLVAVACLDGAFISLRLYRLHIA